MKYLLFFLSALLLPSLLSAQEAHTHADGTTHQWRTEMIINVSKLGALFNQWPTRKLKPAKRKAV